MEALNNFVGMLNGPIWGVGMLILIVGSGLYFTIRLGFFQFAHFGDMWKRILDKGDSESGISTFASFCTTMAMRVGTGNVAGVAVAIYAGGPGAIFWMILAGMTNSAVCFVECVLSSLYKTKIDGEYRGGGPYCAERGLGWKPYAIFLAFVSFIGIGCFMPAAATNTIADGFQKSLGIPMIVTAVVIAAIMAVVIIGGVKRIGTVASYIVPPMVIIYLLAAVAVLIINISEVPHMVSLVIESAFGPKSLIGGGIGVAIQQGVKRGTFSSASGMGESMPPAAAAETSHPVKQGMANAAGVWLDTVIVCTASGLMILLTDAYNTEFGYASQRFAELAGEKGGVFYVQMAASTVLGAVAPTFIAIMLALFSFTCLISYYYEAETAMIYVFEGEGKEGIRKTATWILRVAMIALICYYGVAAPDLAWGLADLALGSITWINMVVVLALSPKAFALYKDYREQMKAGKDPYYDPDKLSWKGVDVALWKEINKKRIEAGK